MHLPYPIISNRRRMQTRQLARQDLSDTKRPKLLPQLQFIHTSNSPCSHFSLDGKICSRIESRLVQLKIKEKHLAPALVALENFNLCAFLSPNPRKKRRRNLLEIEICPFGIFYNCWLEGRELDIKLESAPLRSKSESASGRAARIKYQSQESIYFAQRCNRRPESICLAFPVMYVLFREEHILSLSRDV